MASSDPSATDPVRPAVADATLLAELAAMTPEERLRWNDRMATTILELRHGFADGMTQAELGLRREDLGEQAGAPRVVQVIGVDGRPTDLGAVGEAGRLLEDEPSMP